MDPRHVAALIAMLLAAVPASAQRYETAKLYAADAARDAKFGNAIATSGGIAVIGAFRSDVQGELSGAAYLFDIASGTQLTEILPDDGADTAVFGSAVAIEGGLVAIGAPGDDAFGISSGAVYLFDISDPASPAQLAKLLASDGEAIHGFGSSVALRGDRLLVGAPGDDDNGSIAGATYVFDVSDPTDPVESHKLLANDGEAFDHFGEAVAFCAGAAIIGAPGDDEDAGSVYVFDPSSGQQLAKFVPADAEPAQQFGWSVAAVGTLVLVGSPDDDDNGHGSGSAYVLDLSDPGSPAQLAKIVPNERISFGLFGRSLAADGTTLMIGAPQRDGRGGAYLFDISDPSTPKQTALLVASDAQDGDSLGAAVGLAGAIALAGAPGDRDMDVNAGSVCAFDATPCGVDLTGDAAADTRDFIAFLNLWVVDDPAADWNGDGDVNSADVTAYVNDWVAGC